MKILHTADWHIGQFKGPVVDGVNLRSQDTVNCLNYMIKVAEEEKPDIVCVSGDVFHQEQIGPVRYSDEMIVATDTITKLAGVAKAVIVMRGTPNHDGGGQFRVLSKMFANTGNVHIVTSPTVLRTPYADIACIPGFDKQEFRSRFPGLSADEENEAWTSYISSMVMGLRAECHNTSILMAHYTVPGCNMESGQTSFFTNFEPVIPREALEAAGYEAVLLGHIHRPQQINGLHNVYYSGAINAMNFNDEHQNRGFYIHEFMGGEMTSSQFCGTPYRRFKTIDWDTNQVSDYIGNRDAFLKNGFVDVTSKVNVATGSGLLRGDVLLNEAHHVAMYCGNGKEVEASINEKGTAHGGKPGDQTGKEFLIRSYRNYPWNCVLRYRGNIFSASDTEKKQNTVAYVARFTKDCKCYSAAGKTQAKMFPVIKKNAVVDVMKYTETVNGKKWYFIRIPHPTEGFVREFVPAGYFKKLI